jgi:hypothetical protein
MTVMSSSAPACKTLLIGGRAATCLAITFLILLAASADAMAETAAAGNEDDLAQRFPNPPSDARILKIVHHLPDAPVGQDGLFQSLLDQGFGGIVTNVSFDGYIESEEKWSAFVRGVNAARDMGMALWLYDERGYPSCKAGGLTLRDHPEWQAEGLYIADAVTEGGDIDLAVPPGVLASASAYPVTDGIIDLEHAVDLSANVHDGQLAWNAPAGSCHVMIITKDYLHKGTHADGNLSDDLPYPNLLMPEPTARFIELTHAEYAKRLDNDLSPWFIATFTDEPSLMSMFLNRQPWRVLPWAPNLPGEFETRRGYPLEPLVPVLIADAGAKGRAVRYDFWLTIGELVSENYFGQIQTWGRAHGAPSGGHLLLEEPIVAHVPLYGDFFRCIRRLDAPSMDCLTSVPSSVPWFVARLLSSAAELEGNTVTMSETSDHAERYRAEGDNRPVRVVTEDEIRGTCNRLILNGITTITSYYSFALLSPERLVRLNEWIGRCSTMLKGGHQVADIAVLYPGESVWPRFVPSYHMTENCPPDAQRIQSIYQAVSNSLFEAHRDFTYVDGQALCEATVDNGILKHGDLEWRVVVLPCADTLPMQAWENLAAFWRSGGVVIAVSSLPANSEREFPSPAVQSLAAELFTRGDSPTFATNDAGGAGVYLPPGSDALLPMVLDSLLGQDVRVGEKDAPLRVTHRRIDGHEIFFVINDSGGPWEGALDFAARGAGEQWDPATGTMNPLSSPVGVPAKLGPYGGMLYRFNEAQRPKRKTAAEGSLPGLNLSAIPTTQPTVGMGEFVDGAIEQSSDGAWHANARLTKGEVDTHLFVSYSYEASLDLNSAVCFVLDTTVPDGQSAPTPLRVIVRDAHGAEYIANTDRSMGTPGTQRCYVSLNQFERAGWSQAQTSAFDWSSVTAIRVGWGGYHGTEGETIAFTLSPLQVGHFATQDRPII